METRRLPYISPSSPDGSANGRHQDVTVINQAVSSLPASSNSGNFDWIGMRMAASMTRPSQQRQGQRPKARVSALFRNPFNLGALGITETPD